MAGKHSGCMMWPGSDFEYKGKNCTFTMKLDKNVSFEERIDKAMSWFTHKETPVNLVMMYIEQPDAYSHVYGPQSIQVSIYQKKFPLNRRRIASTVLDFIVISLDSLPV